MTPEQELDLKMLELPPGSVLEIKVSYPESPKTYTYVALEAGGGWYLTNVAFNPALTWEKVVAWFKYKDAEVVSVRQATQWETLL